MKYGEIELYIYIFSFFVGIPIDQAEWDRTAIPGTGVTSTVPLTTVMQFLFSKKNILETSSKQLFCIIMCF